MDIYTFTASLHPIFLYFLCQICKSQIDLFILTNMVCIDFVLQNCSEKLVIMLMFDQHIYHYCSRLLMEILESKESQNAEEIVFNEDGSWTTMKSSSCGGVNGNVENSRGSSPLSTSNGDGQPAPRRSSVNNPVSVSFYALILLITVGLITNIS